MKLFRYSILALKGKVYVPAFHFDLTLKLLMPCHDNLGLASNLSHIKPSQSASS